MRAFIHTPLLLALTSLSQTFPTSRSNNNTISILVTTTSGLDPAPNTVTLQVPLYHLTHCSHSASHLCSASKLTVDPKSHLDVDVNAVECRAYKDAQGLQAGSAPFNVKIPALLSTNLVDIGSMVCYVVET